MKSNDFREAGEKENEVLLVRLTKTQKARLKALAEGSGYKSVSNYVRIQLLNPSIESKLNSIIKLLQEANKYEEKQNDK